MNPGDGEKELNDLDFPKEVLSGCSKKNKRFKI